MVNHPPPFSKGQTLLWPFSYLPETPVLARVSRFVRKGRAAPGALFSRVFRPLCSLFSVSAKAGFRTWSIQINGLRGPV